MNRGVDGAKEVIRGRREVVRGGRVAGRA